MAAKSGRSSISSLAAGLLLIPVGLMVTYFGLPALDGPHPGWYLAIQAGLMLSGVGLILAGLVLTVVGICRK